MPEADVPRGTTPAAEETVEAGRNGKDGTNPGCGNPGSKDELRFVREWTQRHCLVEGQR
jgi:hypothetical protein